MQFIFYPNENCLIDLTLKYEYNVSRGLPLRIVKEGILMIGAIIGDIAGSSYEYAEELSKGFAWFTPASRITDDSIMTIAIGKAFLDSKKDYSDLSEKAIYWMRYFGRKYIGAGYGERFHSWLMSDNPKPYNSFGNGAAMRVSAAGWFANSLSEAVNLAVKVTEVTHNHPDAIKGAVAVSSLIYLCRTGAFKDELESFVLNKVGYRLENLKKDFYNTSCKYSVQVAIAAFLGSKSFIDCINRAILVGGDTDTIAAIAGSIAEAYYVYPEIDSRIIKTAEKYIPEDLMQVLEEFRNSERINRGLII